MLQSADDWSLRNVNGKVFCKGEHWQKCLSACLAAHMHGTLEVSVNSIRVPRCRAQGVWFKFYALIMKVSPSISMFEIRMHNPFDIYVRNTVLWYLRFYCHRYSYIMSLMSMPDIQNPFWFQCQWYNFMLPPCGCNRYGYVIPSI